VLPISSEGGTTPQPFLTQPNRLEAAGEVRVHSETVEQGRPRRLYAITEAGRRSLSAELDRLESDARLGRAMLGTGGAT
jgi:DNA-binding PadR family transcriptional regulator